MGKKILIGMVAVLIVGAWLLWGKYNSLVSLQERVSKKWSQVENVYQRRLDLIPNLVSTVMGYAAHETKTLQNVIEARSKAIQTTVDAGSLNDPKKFQAFAQAQDQLSTTLSNLMVVVEQYPDLKTNENFLELQDQLKDTETRIIVERKRFNEVVEMYNVKVRRFPSNVIASLYGFDKNEFFKSKSEAAKMP